MFYEYNRVVLRTEFRSTFLKMAPQLIRVNLTLSSEFSIVIEHE